MGSLVWTIPSQVKLQVNRVDTFGNNSASNSFFERNTDYCGGIGYVDFDFGEEVFVTPDFGQHLSCYDGLATVRGKSVNVDVLAWNEQDVMAARVRDQRTDPGPVFINLRMLRMPVAKTGSHTATSKISVRGNYIVLTPEFQEDKYYRAIKII